MFLRRLVGIEVTRSFDVSEEGTEGKHTSRNPDSYEWLEQIERERRLQEEASSSLSKRGDHRGSMASASLTVDTGEFTVSGGENIYAEVDEVGIENPAFEAEAAVVKADLAPDVLDVAEQTKVDENQNFYANFSTDGPGALDPAVQVETTLDPGMIALNPETEEDFPGEDFWAGCRSMDLKEWVESVKTLPPDKVKPCVLNTNLSKEHQIGSTGFVEIVDPVFRDGRVEVPPPAGTFSYIRPNEPSRVPDVGDVINCDECMNPASCCSNMDKGRMNNWFWIGLVIFLITVIIIIGIVVGVRGDG